MAFKFPPLGTGMDSPPGVALAPTDSRSRLPDSAMQSCSRSAESRKRLAEFGSPFVSRWCQRRRG